MIATKHTGWLLIVCWVVLCALLSVPIVFNDDSDATILAGPADSRSCSPDETPSLPAPMVERRTLAELRHQNGNPALGLRVAVLGDLCLLI